MVCVTLTSDVCVTQDDPSQRSRSEDRLIAWTWRSYIDNPDPNIDIVARMPMTKVSTPALYAPTWDIVYQL